MILHDLDWFGGVRSTLVALPDGTVAVHDLSGDRAIGRLRGRDIICDDSDRNLATLVYRVIGPKGAGRWVYRGKRVSDGAVWEVSDE
jgi:hypothetical protein